MKKIVISVFSLAILAMVTLIPSANSQIRPYVSGDTINYNGRAYVGTTNSGSFELFRLKNNSIFKEFNIDSHDSEFRVFHDLVFNVEDSRLYVYLVNGRDLLKYDITSLNSVRLVKKVKDNSEDYFFGLGHAGDERIYTIGSKGVKVWNDDLLVVSTYRINLDFNRNLAFNSSGSNIYLVDEEKLKVIDAFWRYDIMVQDLFVNEDHNRKPYVDSITGDTFVVDDGYFKKIKPDGNISEFKHISELGYDVAGAQGKDHLYFSDGVGIVKMRKSDLKPLDWEWTTSLGGGNGWAMGLKTVSTDEGEKVVVFNGSSILVMNDNLTVYDYYRAQENEVEFRPLKMTLSRYRALPKTMITVYGSGFGFNEEMEVTFEGKRYYTYTDPEGNFQTNITVPNISPQDSDIKATGKISEKTYSVGFRID